LFLCHRYRITSYETNNLEQSFEVLTTSNEIGKLLLLEDSKTIVGRYIIKYRNGIDQHRIKSSMAFDYLQLCIQILPTILL